MCDFTKRLLTQWALEEGLTPLNVLRDPIEGEAGQTWWFSCKGKLIPPRAGLCDEEAICFSLGTQSRSVSQKTQQNSTFRNLSKPVICFAKSNSRT